MDRPGCPCEGCLASVPSHSMVVHNQPVRREVLFVASSAEDGVQSRGAGWHRARRDYRRSASVGDLFQELSESGQTLRFLVCTPSGLEALPGLSVLNREHPWDRETYRQVERDALRLAGPEYWALWHSLRDPALLVYLAGKAGVPRELVASVVIGCIEGVVRGFSGSSKRLFATFRQWRLGLVGDEALRTALEVATNPARYGLGEEALIAQVIVAGINATGVNEHAGYSADVAASRAMRACALLAEGGHTVVTERLLLTPRICSALRSLGHVVSLQLPLHLVCLAIVQRQGPGPGWWRDYERRPR